MSAVDTSAVTSPDAPHQNKPGWFGAIVIVLGAGIPILIVDWQSYTGTILNVALAWLLTLASSVRIAYVVTRSRVAILDLGVYLFIYVFAGITPLAQTATGVFPLDARQYSDAAQTRQLLVLLCGFVAFEVGRMISSHRSADRSAKPPLQFSSKGVALIGLVGLAATFQQVATNGVSVFFISRSETARILAGQVGDDPIYTATDKAGIAIQTGLAQFPVFVALFAILYSRRHGAWGSSNRSDPFWRLMIVLLAVANVLVNNPIGNSRLWGLLVIFSFISVYWDVGKPANARVFLVGSLAVLLLAFPLLDAFRFTQTTRHEEFDPKGALVLNPSYPVFQMALNGDEYVRAYGHTDGHQMTSAALAFVPRSAWPGKAKPTGQLIDPRYLRSASAWTEAYVDFGLLGVASLFALLGWVVRYLSARWQRARPGVFQALIPLAAVYVFFLLRGSLLPALGTFYQLAVLFGIAMLFGGRAWLPPGVPPPQPGAHLPRTRR